jgi:hypothetical protein
MISAHLYNMKSSLSSSTVTVAVAVAVAVAVGDQYLPQQTNWLVSQDNDGV